MKIITSKTQFILLSDLALKSIATCYMMDMRPRDQKRSKFNLFAKTI